MKKIISAFTALLILTHSSIGISGEYTGTVLEVWNGIKQDWVRLNGNLSNSTCLDTEWLRVTQSDFKDELLDALNNGTEVTLVSIDFSDEGVDCDFERLVQIRYSAIPAGM